MHENFYLAVRKEIYKICLLFFLLTPILKSFGQLALNASVVNTTCQTKHGHNLNGYDIGTGRINVTVTGGTEPYSYGIQGSNTYTRTQNNGYFPQLYLGNYTVSVSDTKGLRKDTVIHIDSELPIPNFSKPLILNPSICNSADGRITFPTPTSGVTPFLYSIDGGANFSTDNVFNNLREGDYMCSIQDANGCLSFYWAVTLSDTIPCSLGAAYMYVLTACNNDAETQYVSFHNSNGDTAIAYSLDSIHYTFLGGNFTFDSFGSHAIDSFSNLSPGIHNLYLWDTVTNVSTTAIINIAKSCDLYIKFLSVDASCGGSDGALTVNASGGVSPYTYSMDGINFQTNNTFYGLTSGNYTVTVMDANGALSSDVGMVYNKCPQVSLTETDEHCPNSKGIIKASGVKGTKPYLFSIDGINFQSDTVFNGLKGNVTYTITMKDALGFEDSAKIYIGTNCLQIGSTNQDDRCNYHDGSIQVWGYYGTPPYLYSIDGINYQTNQYFSNLKKGVYTIYVKDVDSSIASQSVTISNYPDEYLNLGNDTTLCTGKTLALSFYSPIATTYTWQDGSTADSFLVTKPGTYWLTVFDYQDYCYFYDTINVAYLNLTNQIFPIHDTTLCIGNSITLNAQNSGAAYLWNNNATTQTQTETTSGKYWVQVNVGGCSASDTINLHFITGPTITLPADTSFCTGNSVTLNAGNGAATYLWNNNATTNSVSVNQGGKYWVAATQYGCTNVDTVQVTQYPTPTVFLGNDTVICAGQILLLSAPISTPAYQYLWQDNSTANTYLLSNTGLYSVKVTNQYNCAASDSINVRVRPLPVFSLGNDTTLCTAKTLQLNINLPKDKFLWNTGNTTSSTIISNAGLYWLQVSDSGCAKTDSLNVSYKPNPQVFLGNDTTLCEGDNLLLNAINNDATYQWQDGTTQPTYNVTTQGTYSVKVTAANGCDTTGKIVIEYISKPIINLGNDTTLCLSDKLILNAAYPNSSYLWQDNSTQSTYTVTQAGMYKVEVANVCGNTTDSINIQYQDCACEFYVPSAFTPNGDSKNDIFKPSYKCFFSNYLFRIFNRWGQTIFSTQNTGEGWNGKLNGQNQPVGTYIWELTYYDTLLKKNETKTGTVVLVR